MKIDPRIQLPGDAQPERVKNSRNTPVRSEHPSGSPSTSASVSEDTVRLSTVHSDVQQLTVALSSVPEVRTHRVDALQHRVRSGNYAPDNQKIADALIAESKNRTFKS